MLASVTRLRVRSVRNLPAFLWMTFLVLRQTSRTVGFLGGRILIDNLHTYWTLTAWENETAMKAFRGSGPHAGVMPKLVEWCDEAAYTHWIGADDSIPEWLEAYDHLVSDGRLSRVALPSRDHASRIFPKPRLRPLIEQNLKPAALSRKSAA